MTKQKLSDILFVTLFTIVAVVAVSSIVENPAIMFFWLLTP